MSAVAALFSALRHGRTLHDFPVPTQPAELPPRDDGALPQRRTLPRGEQRCDALSRGSEHVHGSRAWDRRSTVPVRAANLRLGGFRVPRARVLGAYSPRGLLPLTKHPIPILEFTPAGKFDLPRVCSFVSDRLLEPDRWPPEPRQKRVMTRVVWDGVSQEARCSWRLELDETLRLVDRHQWRVCAREFHVDIILDKMNFEILRSGAELFDVLYRKVVTLLSQSSCFTEQDPRIGYSLSQLSWEDIALPQPRSEIFDQVLDRRTVRELHERGLFCSLCKRNTSLETGASHSIWGGGNVAWVHSHCWERGCEVAR